MCLHFRMTPVHSVPRQSPLRHVARVTLDKENHVFLTIPFSRSLTASHCSLSDVNWPFSCSVTSSCYTLPCSLCPLPLTPVPPPPTPILLHWLPFSLFLRHTSSQHRLALFSSGTFSSPPYQECMRSSDHSSNVRSPLLDTPDEVKAPDNEVL